MVVMDKLAINGNICKIRQIAVKTEQKTEECKKNMSLCLSNNYFCLFRLFSQHYIYNLK